MFQSLAIHAPWSTVSSALELAGPQGLPIVVRCPRCGRESLHVCQDTIKGFPWHQCKSCGIKGDLLQLLCNAWECSPAAALDKLGAPSPTDGELAKYKREQDRLARFDKLFEDASRRLYHDPSSGIAKLQERLQLNSTYDVPLERWLDGPGRIIGSSVRKEVERTFCPDTDRPTCELGSAPVFPGGGWREVLAFPFYDLPGRICGVYLVGRKAEPRDRIFKRVYSATNAIVEAGLCGLPSVLASPHGPVVAVADPVFVAWMNIRHLQYSASPLPMVAWHSSAMAITRNAWTLLTGRRVIFWSAGRLDATMLAQAIRVNGRIYDQGPSELTDAAIFDFAKNRGTPADFIISLNANAKPWRVTLSQWLKEVREGAIADLIVGLERCGVDPHWIAAELKGDAQDRFKLMLLQRASPEAMFTWQGKVLKETEAGTFLLQKKVWVQIANFRVRVDRSDGLHTEGRIIQGQQEYPFSVSAAELERGNPGALTIAVIKGGGQPLSYTFGWMARLFRMALSNGSPIARVEPGQAQGPEDSTQVAETSEGL